MTMDEIIATLPQGPFAKGEPWIVDYILIKEHRRLWVVRRHDGLKVYTPPNFVRVHGREQFAPLLLALSHGTRPIDVIMAFETKHTPIKASRRSATRVPK